MISIFYSHQNLINRFTDRYYHIVLYSPQYCIPNFYSDDLLEQLHVDLYLGINSLCETLRRTFHRLNLNDLARRTVQLNTLDRASLASFQIRNQFDLYLRALAENYTLIFEAIQRTHPTIPQHTSPIYSLLSHYTLEIGALFRILHKKYHRQIALAPLLYGLDLNDLVISFIPSTKISQFERGLLEAYRFILSIKAAAPAPTVIGFRHDGYGAGAKFDHLNFQIITEQPTAMSLPQGHRQDLLYKHLRKIDCKLPQALYDLTDMEEDGGLLVLTGQPRKAISDPRRKKEYLARDIHEINLIKRALRRGQPMLFICGGLWRFIWYFNGKTISTETHTGLMPDILPSGQVINDNPRAHHVIIKKNSRLFFSRGDRDRPVPDAKRKFAFAYVNSVHWKAVNPESLPKRLLRVAAFTDTGSSCSVEAVEFRHGDAIGIQWHPETARRGQPGREGDYAMIRQLAEKGAKVYHANRAVIAEIVTNTPNKLLEKIGFFSRYIRNKNRVLEQELPPPKGLKFRLTGG